MLSQMLGAREPAFRLGLKQLERASGGASEDIRLTSEVIRNRRDCLKQLGLDPDDTTGRELYAALMQRVKEDSEVFDSLLGLGEKAQGAGEDDNIMPYIDRFVRALQPARPADSPDASDAKAASKVFALKAATAKRLLRAHPPKRALKQLGYRSIESVLKHEPATLLFAAAAIAEKAPWHKSMQAAYKKLKPSDFELREVQILAPQADRWQKLSYEYVNFHKNAVMSFREQGAVVLLPLSAGQVRGASLAVTLLVLQAINDIRAASTYLKLHLVRPDFAAVVARVAAVHTEPLTKAEVGGSYLPWKLVHYYFARHPEAYNPDIFEPHVHQEDLQWHAAEDSLAELHPRFSFWQSAACAGLLERGEMISFNLLDAVLSFCNTLPFEQRLIHAARGRLWQELMLRYMRQSNIEQAVHQQLSSELVDAGNLS